MSAATLHRSQTGLGAYFRKIKSRAGTSKAITATAHKLARYIYAMLKNGQEYTSQSIEEYETKFKEKTLRYLHKKAQLLGFELQPIPSLT